MRAPNTDQLKFMEMTAKARVRCAELAKEADRLELMTLAREWDYFGKGLEKSIQNQLRVFDDVPLEVPERTT
jgi:hypothetical protein